MFGLMRGKGAERRRHYCGTCKTIGRSYGQAARLLLNHDTVFLAELLTFLLDGQSATWQAAYQSRNCFSLPHGDMPPALQFAAAATITLADAKLADHATDSRRPWWRWTRFALTRQSRRAANTLRQFGLPIEEVQQLLATQQHREHHSTEPSTWAEPTAHTTGLFFRHGALLIERTDLAGAMYDAGYHFGTLVYLLDAWEDYDQDRRTGAFNALYAAYGERRLSVVEEAARQTARSLRSLGADLFAARLQSNVAAKLGLVLPVVCGCALPREAHFAGASGGAILLGQHKLPKPHKAWHERCSCCSGCSDYDCGCCDSCCDALDCCSCCGEGCSVCESCGSCGDCCSCDCSCD